LQLRERLILNLPTEDLREDTEDHRERLPGLWPPKKLLGACKQ
jgi:hypothetical protein